MRRLLGFPSFEKPFIPYPGPKPLRLRVEARVIYKVAGHFKSRRRFVYDGIFNTAPIRYAKRLAKKQSPAVVKIWIYGKNGILYCGTTENGLAHPLFSAYFMSPTVQTRGDGYREIAFPKVTELIPVRLGKETVYFYADTDGLFKDDRQRKFFCYRRRERIMAGMQ